jgi:hypothetical protein
MKCHLRVLQHVKFDEVFLIASVLRPYIFLSLALHIQEENNSDFIPKLKVGTSKIYRKTNCKMFEFVTENSVVTSLKLQALIAQ